MAVSVGEFREWLSQFPPETPIVIDLNTDEGVYLHIDEVLYTTDEASEPGKVQVEIFWDASPGWVQQLLTSANDVRRELGLSPLE